MNGGKNMNKNIREYTNKHRFLIKFMLLTLSIFIIICNIFYNFGNAGLNNLIAGLVLFFSIYMLILFRKDVMAFILFLIITYFNYSIVFSRYLHVLTNIYQEFYINVNERIYGIGITILLIFMLCLYVFINIINKNHHYDVWFSREKKNPLIVIILIIILLLIFIFSFDRSLYGSRGATSSIYEYSSILFIMAYYYCGNKKGLKAYKVVISIIIFVFSLQGFIFGERVSGMQFLIVFFAFILSSKVTYKTVLLLTFLGLFTMTSIGAFRSSYAIEDLSIKVIYNTLSQRMLTFDGADLAYYSSLTFVMVRDITDLLNHIQLFGKFFLSIFFGSSLVQGAELAKYTRQYYMHWYGGYYPFFFYYYFGWTGCVIFSIIISKILKSVINLKDSSQNYYKLLKIYIISSTPRWYAYSPQMLFRGVLLFTIVYLCFEFVNKITSIDKYRF